MFELNTKRLWKMSYQGIMRKISWSFRSKRIKQLLRFAIEKIEYFDDGVYLYKHYNGYFDPGQEAKFNIVMKRLVKGNHELRRELFDLTQDIGWLRIAPPDNLSFCMLMIQRLSNDSKAARDAYEKAKGLVFSGEKIGFWDLYELYSVRKNKALWKRVWKELNREDNLWLGGIEKILKQTGKKDVLSLWISKKADNINTWNTILRACPKRLRKLACKELAAYYLKLADDPEIYKRESL